MIINYHSNKSIISIYDVIYYDNRLIVPTVIIMYMNNHIYSTLYKRLERKSDRRSKETEQRKNHKTHTHTHKYIYIYKIFVKKIIIQNKTKTNRTCDLSIYCINIKLSSSLSGLEKYIFTQILNQIPPPK